MSTKKDKLKATILNGDSISSQLCELIRVNANDRADAELILKLREQHAGNFLKKGAETLVQQVNYLESYQKRFLAGEEIYYKIFDKKKGSVEGVFRLTQLNSPENLNWESLVVSKVCTPMVPIDVMMAVYDICFRIFDATKCGPWEVKVAHKNMMEIHDFCKMYKIEKRTEESYWISVTKSDYQTQIPRFKKLGLGLVLDNLD